MAIRDRFRRALTKSGDSSSNTSSQNDITITTITTTTSSDTSNSSNSIRKQHSKFLSWRNRNSDEKNEKKQTHPRDKPLTPTNIQHQQMLGQFTMTFGSSPSRMSQLCLPDLEYDGVSPCCTRTPSIINSDAISANISRLDITEH